MGWGTMLGRGRAGAGGARGSGGGAGAQGGGGELAAAGRTRLRSKTQKTDDALSLPSPALLSLDALQSLQPYPIAPPLARSKSSASSSRSTSTPTRSASTSAPPLSSPTSMRASPSSSRRTGLMLSSEYRGGDWLEEGMGADELFVQRHDRTLWLAWWGLVSLVSGCELLQQGRLSSLGVGELIVDFSDSADRSTIS